jgi:hydroxyacylglutathione hydrolase
MYFEQIFEEKLAQYAYLIGCQKTGEAIVIDPMRDIDRYIAIAEKNDLNIVAAAETHIHADYLSGMREFAERGVKVYVSDEGDADWKYEWIIGSKYDHKLLKDQDTFNIGNIKFRVLHSPGHTPEHISYLVADGAATDEPMGILSGDFIFVGDVGRPDLLETAAGQEGVMENSARVLYKSLKKFMDLPDYMQVWPGHGAGSACGKALGAVPDSTVGYEQRFNGSIRAATSEDDFVDFILEGQPEPPLYFARMKRDNKLGPKVLGEIPQPEKVSIEEMREHENAVIIDTRERLKYMEKHIPGSIYAPVNKAFNTVAGSYVTEDEDIYLIVDEEKLEEAVLDLIRIGLDNIMGYATTDEMNNYLGETVATPVYSFDDINTLLDGGDYQILDVRKKTEFDESHVSGAVNIAHTRLLERYQELPKDKPVITYCRTGARASAAVSLLEQKGYEVYHINDNIEEWLARTNVKA